MALTIRFTSSRIAAAAESIYGELRRLTDELRTPCITNCEVPTVLLDRQKFAMIYSWSGVKLQGRLHSAYSL